MRNRESKGFYTPTAPIISRVKMFLKVINLCGLERLPTFRILSEDLQDRYAEELFLSQHGEGGIRQLAYPGGG